MYGAYERDADEEGPFVTFGDSRDHRPDRTQRLFGLTVTADGVPVWGHGSDGHRRDSAEPRCHLPQLRPQLPDRSEPLVGADRQFCAGETMALAAVHRCHGVTLVPHPGGRRQERVEAPELGALPLGWEQPGRRKEQRERDHGTSMGGPSRWKTEAGEAHAWPWRFLGVESTPLAKAKARRRAAAQHAPWAQLTTLQRRWQQRAWACGSGPCPASM